MKKTPLERFTDGFTVQTDCWLWKKTILQSGYGQVYWDGRRQYAHRVSYMVYKGPIPDGLTIDHLCRVRKCVNPAHLEAVSNRENIVRGFEARGFDRANMYKSKFNRRKPLRERGFCRIEGCTKPMAVHHTRNGKLYYKSQCAKHRAPTSRPDNKVYDRHTNSWLTPLEI